MNSMSNKKYEELTFIDDFMFCKVLVNNLNLCKGLLELILGIQIKRIVDVTKQKTIEITADARSVRLDVYVEDDEESVFDVEMQTTVKKDLPKRSRYYQGMIDLNLIEKGAKYGELKRSYVIFICMEDPFGRGLSVYTFENRCKEASDLLLGDETVKVFINVTGDTTGLSAEMKAFLEYLKDGNKDGSLFVTELEEQVQKAREHLEWRTEYMTLQMRYDEIAEEAMERGMQQGLQRGLQQGLQQGIEQGIVEIIRKKLAKGMTVGEIADMLEQTTDEVKRLIAAHEL